MKHIQFHGPLALLYPEGIKVEGDSPAECLTALQFFEGFKPDSGKYYQVVLPDFQSRQAIFDKTDREIIHVHSVIEGAGGKVGALLQIAIGILLIYTGWGAAGGVKLLGVTIAQSTLVMTGAMMILGGVTSLLMPQPKLSTSTTDEKRSNYLNSTRNTVRIGTRVPLIFGTRKWFGHYLSFNITATNLDAPAPDGTSPGADGWGADGWDVMPWDYPPVDNGGGGN